MQALDDVWISSEGPLVKQFEERMAARCGRSFGVACANGPRTEAAGPSRGALFSPSGTGVRESGLRGREPKR